MSSARNLNVAALAVLVLGACADKSEPRPQADPPPVTVTADAGVANAGPTVSFDPTSGYLDDGPSTTTGVRPAARRATRPIEIVVRSTPNGARVFVDGEDRGTTPVLWQGDTGEHAFTFVKKDHAMARYRFWAITSGIVHARLDPVAEEIKGGTPPPELLARPVPAPDAPDAPVMAAPVDAAVPLAPAVDAHPSIDAASGSPIGPPVPF